MPAILLTAFLLHNTEEAITFWAYREDSEIIVRQFLWADYTAPANETFIILLCVVSLLAGVTMVWTYRHPKSQWAGFYIKSLAWIMLVNVLIPHVPAALLLKGYTPGLLTAVLINLPSSLVILIELRTISKN